MQKNIPKKTAAAILAAAILFLGGECRDMPEAAWKLFSEENVPQSAETRRLTETVDGKGTIPVFEGRPFSEINGNVPDFGGIDGKKPMEEYSKLDSLGRCGPAIARIGRETMPTEKRRPIGMIKPSGWHTVRYDKLIEDKYLYNRCHLIAFMLAGENANERNLITGTRYLNVQSMLPFEEKVNDYVKTTGNHVLYRATPIFIGEELVARGVRLEAMSVEDNGKGVSFHVFCHNVQPGIRIDYRTGYSEEEK